MSVFSYDYNISAVVGDTLRVKASCNQDGTIIETLTIQSVNPTESVPAYPVCVTLAGLSILAIVSVLTRRR
ncbi:MAG: hypothetical protein HZR80_11795 [Candidatus Heimdallarchaeota archaeon]